MAKQKTLLSFFGLQNAKHSHVGRKKKCLSMAEEPSNQPQLLPVLSAQAAIVEVSVSDSAKINSSEGRIEEVNSNTAISDGSIASISPDKTEASIEIQNRVATEEHHPDTRRIDTNELSEYEKFRLHNIKRNHDRLVALGLVNPTAVCPIPTCPTTSSTGQKKKKRRHSKKTKTAAFNRSIPLRRSARNKNIPLEKLEVGTEDNDIAQVATEVNDVRERFEDSPLVQYFMQSQSNENEIQSKVRSLQEDDKFTSLFPTGPRLLSLKANNAIYTLDILKSEYYNPIEWLVGAGKSGIISIWNCSAHAQHAVSSGLDPILSWKGHKGWVCDAIFTPCKGDLNNSNASSNIPSHLLTASNDGKVCMWDTRSTSCHSRSPEIIAKADKALHSGGIFSMDVDLEWNNYSDINVCTGSKDKTLAVSTLESIATGMCKPTFVSHHHSAKVGCVKFQGQGSSLIGSASDDGSIALHDFRCHPIVADIDFAHDKPHSIVWEPGSHNFITAGFDPNILRFDSRNLKGPISTYHGHVPLSSSIGKVIHRPNFLSTYRNESRYIISGSQKSSYLSIFQATSDPHTNNNSRIPVYSRGYLPDDCGDARCIAVSGPQVAVAVDGGEVLLLEPTR